MALYHPNKEFDNYYVLPSNCLLSLYDTTRTLYAVLCVGLLARKNGRYWNPMGLWQETAFDEPVKTMFNLGELLPRLRVNPLHHKNKPARKGAPASLIRKYIIHRYFLATLHLFHRQLRSCFPAMHHPATRENLL
jgi:hypothetical protein